MTQPTGSSDPQPANTVEGLTDSARGWHTIQVGVLGFVGLCGVLRPTGGAAPAAVQWLAAALALISLVLACVAILAVGRVAYPVSAGAHPDVVAQARGRLRSGIRLTIIALVIIVAAALTGWWPHRVTAAPATPAKAVTVTTGAHAG